MKILVTGVCGFVGSHLARTLVQGGWTVYGVDNLSYGHKENVADLNASNRFSLHELDVTQDGFLSEFTNKELDAVVHFACAKTRRDGKRMETLHTNALGTENALEVARANQARFLYGSTGELYGKSLEYPFTEESGFRLGKPEIRRWASVVSQMYSEHLCFAYNEKYDLDFTVIRFFNIYGPAQSMDSMGGPQAVFIQAALANQPMEIHGDGVQSRDLTYIDDAIEGVVHVLQSSYASGEIINIGSEEKVSIINLAYMIWRLSGNTNKPKLEFFAYPDFPHLYEEIRHRNCDTTKARCLLGFQSRTTLEEGLKTTIEWHRKKMEQNVS
ncbi:MAG: NAD-dependent epimerase/dehydratase family protein [Nitrospinota bacterium]|nr:NAD-dependent epimerase/dehydratase family protein [Nitrospinota bacterium]